MSEETTITETTEVIKPQGKVWTDEYVQGLREENKTRRLTEKAAITKLKGIIGLKEDDDLSDDKITAYQTRQTEQLNTAMQKANARLITAEIKSLDGFDSKLVERLIDKSKIKINEDGTIEGLKEAVEALAVEFPQIKVAQATQGGTNPPISGTKTAQTDYEDAVKASQQHPGDSSLMQTVFLLKEKLKK